MSLKLPFRRYVEHKKAVKEDSSDSASESESGEEETASKAALPAITQNTLPSGCCGTIKYIECIDFMCHKHLKVKLGGAFLFPGDFLYELMCA